MTTAKSKIIYTLTDEAPLLATCSLLPVIRTFTAPAGIDVVTSDISLAARILAEFSDYLGAGQKVPDNLGELGRPDSEPRYEHHQAAQHQRLGPAVDGRRQGIAGARLQDSRLP